MELYQLRTFVTVAEEGNLTRAAARLCTSQPAVSAHIKTLEEEFGVRLFDRTRQGMALTAAGRRLETRARELLDGSKALLREAEQLKGQVGGRLRIGINHPPEFLRTESIIARLAEEHPQLRVALSFGSCGAVQQDVAGGDLDAAFFDGPCIDKRLCAGPLTEHDLRVVAPRDWAADLDTASWKVLETKPWVFVSPLCSYYVLLMQVFQRRRLTLPVRFEVDDERSLFDQVTQGRAMTVLAEPYLSLPQLADRVWVWPHFQQPMPVSICCLRERRAEPALRAFLETTRAVWQTTPAGVRKS